MLIYGLLIIIERTGVFMNISYEQEKNLVKGILLASDFSDIDAGIMADVVAHSDFTGVYSHGLSRLTRYLRQIKVGALNNRPNFQKVLDNKAVSVFDCDNGSGIVSVNKAYDDVLVKARDYGIAIGTGRRNANIGCGSYYGWRAAKDDVIAIICCNTYAFSSPFGGADRLLGTNPIVIAVPTDKEYPMVLDISTTEVAMGKIQAFEREGKEIPNNWAKGFDGSQTTNPAEAFSLNSIAGHKGYGLSVMVDVLSTMLSKACYGSDIGLFSKLEPENTGFCIIVIDPSKFMPIEEFKATADNYIRMMKSSRKAPGVEEIFMPGELEYKKFEELKLQGLDVSVALENELVELCISLGAIEDGANFEDLVKFFN